MEEYIASLAIYFDLSLCNLPDEVYHRCLFNYLDLNEILELRLINKRFRSLVKSYEIKEIWFIPQHDNYKFKSIWFSTTRRIKIGNQLLNSKLGLLNSPLQVFNLKYLRLEKCPFTFNINDLNKFEKLEVLMIKDVQIKDGHDYHLKLPQLRSFSIHKCGYGNLKIETPNLQSLDLHSLPLISILTKTEFTNSLTLRYLRITRFDKSLLVFRNVEFLEIVEGTASSDLNIDILKFEKLKRLRVSSNPNLKRKFEKLKEILKAKKSNLEVVLEGVILMSCDKINELENMEDNLRFQLRNYALLEDGLDFVNRICYDRILDLFPYNQPATLFRKYNNIQYMEIQSVVKDERRLINFIRGCPYLFSLSINITGSLSQNFYNLLPLVSSLSQLLIMQSAVLDFRFITYMTDLTFFRTNQDPHLEHAVDLNRYKFLEIFMFEIKTFNGNDASFIIFKMGLDKYKVYCQCIDAKQPSKDYISFEEIVRWSLYLQSNAYIF